MGLLLSLWAPILLSAVGVFIASVLIHMVLGYHKSDYQAMPSEDAVMEALRKFNIPPGDYFVPHPGSPEHMRSAEYDEKVKKGPAFWMTVMSGEFAMGTLFGQWFAYTVVISAFAAFLAVHAVAPGASFKRVFHVVGLTAFASYGLALWPISIWYKRKWSTTVKANVDALIFGVVTGAIFGWLWPR